MRLQQQRADFAGCADVADALGLAQHAGFVFGAQVRQQPGADVDAFADVQRQVALLAMEGVNARTGRGVFDGFAQVLRVFVGPVGFEVVAAAA